MVTRVKVSSRNQIAVPASVRKELGIDAGDYLLVRVRDGEIVLIPEPESYTDRLRGLGAEIWEGVDPVEYVRSEREAWRDPSSLFSTIEDELNEGDNEQP